MGSRRAAALAARGSAVATSPEQQRFRFGVGRPRVSDTRDRVSQLQADHEAQLASVQKQTDELKQEHRQEFLAQERKFLHQMGI